jgi:hypothetical protein
VATVGGNANNPNVNLSWQDNSGKEARFRIERATNIAFTAGLTTFTFVNPSLAVPNTVNYQDTTVASNNLYWYRVIAEGDLVGDTQTAGFPTMKADSLPLTTVNNVSVQVGNVPTRPVPPTNLTATLQAGPQATLAWRDNATNETGFAVERCTGAACTAFAQIAVAPPRNNTGNTSFVDTTVAPGNTYRYRVAAINGASVPPPPLIYAGPTDNVAVPAIPPAPVSLSVAVVKASGNNYTATQTWTWPTNPVPPNPTNFTIQRATNAMFTTNLSTFTAAGNLRTLVQTVNRNTTYYYRIRANNSISGSSAWTNAQPIRTGN